MKQVKLVAKKWSFCIVNFLTPFEDTPCSISLFSHIRIVS